MAERADPFENAVRALRHDARNLLNTLELTREHVDAAGDEKTRRLVAYLEDKLAAMVRLADRAHLLARIRQVDSLGQERVDQLVGRAAASLEPDAEHLVIGLPDTPVACDPLLAELAIAEVLGNAMATTFNVHVTFDAERNAVVVRDEGPGIPHAAMADLLTPFRGARKPGGASAGLAIADAAMRAQRGELHIATGEAGTEVRLVFPAS